MRAIDSNPLPTLFALLNVGFLLVHQIDAAFWHEWDMFGLAGGNQLNLVFNVPIVLLVVHAYGKVAVSPQASAVWQYLIAALGFVTLIVHSVFFAAGRSEFAQPVSLVVFAAIAVCSCAQLYALRRRDQ